jgi:hypothetical protein
MGGMVMRLWVMSVNRCWSSVVYYIPLIHIIIFALDRLHT